MKGHLSKFLLLPLLLPFCFSSTTLTKAGQFDPAYFPPLEKGEDYYEMNLLYNYHYNVSTSVFTFTLTTREHSYGGGGTSQVVSRHTFNTIVAGHNQTVKLRINYDKLKDERNTNNLLITVNNGTSFSTEIYSFYLNYSESHTIEIKKENSSYERQGDGHYEDFDSSTEDNNSSLYNWTGFKGDFENPEYQLLPLRKLKFRMRNEEKDYIDYVPSSVVLSIYDPFNFHNIGKLTGAGTNKRMDVPLQCTFSNHYTYFRTKEKIIYSPDYRTVRTNGAITSADHVSHMIFLPPIDNGEIRTTKFALTMKGVGPYKNDVVTYEFTVTQTYNYIGSYPVSEWYVEEC